MKLGKARVEFPQVPWVSWFLESDGLMWVIDEKTVRISGTNPLQAALTATASKHDEQGIIDALKLRKVLTIRTSSFRKNLYYDVYFKDTLKGEEFAHLARFICDALGEEIDSRS